MLPAVAQVNMEEMWDKTAAGKEHPNIKWFKEAKFGMFIHWGLYAKLAGTWKGKNYYGSGEWIMNQAKIRVAEYEKVAAEFNPVDFNAAEWAQLAKDAGIKYMVITAKHHEGFAMYDSKVSDFNIVKATPYKKDPMRSLSEETRKRGIQFGFYYSQFIDWHEPNGGRNSWDFDEKKKDYLKYYREKGIPQLKELMTNYGPLGIVWFDMPGGLTKEQTQHLVDTLRGLQPQTLFSSRVGQGLGDYKDFGDSEIPATPIDGPWESIYTHNDSWGYIEHDMNFKSPREIIRLLASVASKGGNLMLNIGPDGTGKMPVYSIRYLLETGKWLQTNGESIYGTTYGFIPEQPWGVTTSKPGKLYLHIFNRPASGKLLVPGFQNEVKTVYSLKNKKPVNWKKSGTDILIDLPLFEVNDDNTVFVVEYKGTQPAYQSTLPLTISSSYADNRLEAVHATKTGATTVSSITYSHYFGDWKHATVVGDMKTPEDGCSFQVRVTEPGDYKIILEYACPQASANQEGILQLNGKDYFFRTLRTSELDRKGPVLFIQHAVAICSVQNAGNYTINIRPMHKGNELFKLKSIVVAPVN